MRRRSYIFSYLVAVTITGDINRHLSVDSAININIITSSTPPGESGGKSNEFPLQKKKKPRECKQRERKKHEASPAQ